MRENMGGAGIGRVRGGDDDVGGSSLHMPKFLALTFAGAISLAGQRIVVEVSYLAVNGFSVGRCHLNWMEAELAPKEWESTVERMICSSS